MSDQFPWASHYDAEVPAHLEYPDFTIQDYLERQVKETPGRMALICEDKVISYAELYSSSRNFAEHLVELGLKPGDRVGICLPNTIEFVISFFGTLMAGGVVAAMNPFYPLPEWQYQTKIVSPKILIGLKTRAIELFELKQKSGSEQLILVDVKTDQQLFPKVYEDVNYVAFEKCIISPETQVKLPLVNTLSPAVLQFSGGTTGLPKAALALHCNVAANILQFTKWLTTLKQGEEVFLTLIPLYHVYGMVIGLNVGIAMGAAIVLLPDGKNLDKTLQLIQEHKVTFFPGVPSIYQAINRNQRVLAGEVNLSSIKACISGSAPLLPETREQFEKLTGGKLVEGYGLSEAPTATHCNPIQGENRNGSIGLPLPDVECKIVHLEDDSKIMPIGESGQLLIRSPQVMLGYYGSPSETALVMKEDWLYTGDIAKMDEDGYFYILGRHKDLIKVNGLQVWPTEVEEVLVRHHKISEAAVAGVYDEITGEAVKAWVVMRDYAPLDPKDVQLFCRSSLAGYKIPKEIVAVEKLPKSPVGKLLRRELVNLNQET
ncbi:MAG: long-chain fatty acid--CoA ligase [Chloroflexi bacterium HGW-Chloroflexi-4]|jgi:long-chain acyl-CoA synthetase|nr:MAG: long-chain fatty acid--CoA ligase [Chloroflexi bacterium HGW-Chloroflexi-4]